jgi:outer membrane murein-binding lipoprotein Lpp
MKYALVLCAMLLAGCIDQARPAVLSYDQLLEFIPDCENKQDQLKQLKYIQTVKKFPENPEDIRDETARAYNSRLKAIIWWYTYRCES